MSKPTQITARCPIRTTLELTGGKWKLLILVQLKDACLRLSELKRAIPDISEKMLVQELKNMQDSHLIIRTNHGEVPPRVDYQLTELGRKALPLIDSMAEYGLLYQKTLFGHGK